MSIGERLFQTWISVRQSLADRFADERGERAALKEVLERFKTLSALLARGKVDIEGGHFLDEARGCIVLPDYIDILSSKEQNVRLYLHRLVFACTAWELGQRAPSGLPAEVRLLYTVLSVPMVRSEIDRVYPGLAAERQALASELLALPNGRRSTGTRSALLDSCIERQLGAAPTPAGSEAARWTEDVIEASLCRDPFSRVSELALRLQRIAPRPGTLDARRSIMWALSSPASEVTGVVPSPGRDSSAAGTEKIVDLKRTVHAKLRDPTKEASAPLFHSFEKTETAEDYEGEKGDAEGADVESDQAAIEDLKLSTVHRSLEDSRGLVKADLVLEGLNLEVADEPPGESSAVFRYPEWNYSRGEYRHGWCTLIERAPLPASRSARRAIAEFERRNRLAIEDIRKHLVRLFSERQVRNRQLDGPDIDLEAVVERHADLAAGHTPNPRLYLSERKASPDVSLLLLFDTSLSTDSWVEGRRVLDIAIESIVILSSAFSGYLDDEVAIAHFNSRTRNECNFSLLKRFGEPWQRLHGLVTTIEPHGYTRIGPAVRHATSLLRTVTARKKILLLVTDGKPSDYDRYEGRYGIEDVARAVREARQQRISTFALTIDKEAKHYMARMLGAGKFRILPRAELLPQSMADFLLQAVA